MGIRLIVDGKVIDNGSSIPHNEQDVYNSQPDSNANKVNQAAIVNPDIYRDQARANNDAANAAQKALLDGELRAATNLQPIGYDQYGRVGTWQVKPTKQG